MKKFSKLFWVALVVVAVLACTAIGVFAAETNSTAVVFAEATEVAENANFDAVIKYKDNSSKVECGKITLTWDSELMSVTSIAKADALNGAQFGYNSTTPGTAVIAWAGSNIDAGTEGNLFTVTFKNESIANDGYAAIEVVVDDLQVLTHLSSMQ